MPLWASLTVFQCNKSLFNYISNAMKFNFDIFTAAMRYRIRCNFHSTFVIIFNYNGTFDITLKFIQQPL